MMLYYSALLRDELPITTAWTAVITAVATVVTAFGGLILAMSVLIPILRNSRSTVAAIAEVHTIVNQQRTDAQRYNIALTEVLRRNGLDIPIDQSLPVDGHDDAKPGQPTSLPPIAQ